MRITSSTGYSESMQIKAKQNAGKASQNKSMQAGSFSGANADTVEISKQGRLLSKQNKASGIIEGLLKRKQSIADSRSSLLEKTLEAEGNTESIKEKLEKYDEMLTDIDEQISKVMFEENQKKLEKANSEKKNPSSQRKTEQDIEKEKLTGFISLVTDLSQVKELNSARIKTEGAVRVQKSEIKTDEGRGVNPKRKRAALAKMESSLAKMSEKIGDVSTRINKQTQNAPADTEITPEEKKEEDTRTKDDSSDDKINDIA